MACSDWGYAIEAAKNEEFIEWIWCPLANQLGAPVVGLLIYGGIALYIYERTGSAVIPLQLAIIFGAGALSWMAATAVSIAAAGVLFVVSVVGVLVIRRIAQ